jgi:hypothetical protein
MRKSGGNTQFSVGGVIVSEEEVWRTYAAMGGIILKQVS